MPQGRRKDFSGKAKKEQLQKKRNKAPGKNSLRSNDFDDVPVPDQVTTVLDQDGDDESKVVASSSKNKSDILTDVDFSAGNQGRSRYNLVFQKESKAEIAALKEKARQPFKPVPASDLEVDVEQCFPDSLDYPKRPPWDPAMSKTKVEANEARYFREYVNKVMAEHDGDGQNQLSYFELNLETWRQLWRVTEMSDILLLIVDSRFPAAMMPPSLYKTMVTDRKKDVILVLNKVDLIPAGLAIAWRDYFKTKFPGIHVTFFTSCPAYNLRKPEFNSEGLLFRRLRGRISMAKEGALQIFNTVKSIVGDRVDLTAWGDKIKHFHDDDQDQEESQKTNTNFVEGKNLVTIGMVGQPNVGKSSLINSLVGKRVVSVSKTPGHTKHFQTIFICPTVKLADCPGLVFPSLVPRPLQVILGSYPIAQTKEPFSVVQYLAERLDLPKILKLPNQREKWSAYDICEAWAEKRGYMTARSQRLDVARSANHILRMTLEGRIMLALRPPKYEPAKWTEHPDVAVIEDLLAMNKIKTDDDDDVPSQEDEDSLEESGDEQTDVKQPAAPKSQINSVPCFKMTRVINLKKVLIIHAAIKVK